MRIFILIATAALVTLAGCGGDDNSDNNSSSNPADTAVASVTAWKDAANSYNALLQTCRVFPKQPGETNVVPRCTRAGRKAYARETARLNKALAANLGSSPECQAAVAKTKALVAKDTPRLDRAYRLYVAAERANETGAPYKGPPVAQFLLDTNKVLRSDVKTAGSLGKAIKDSCAS